MAVVRLHIWLVKYFSLHSVFISYVFSKTEYLQIVREILDTLRDKEVLMFAFVNKTWSFEGKS